MCLCALVVYGIYVCVCVCVQGFSFLWRYVELRGVCQESMYNLGRALHQMSLTHLAIHYYQKALALPPPTLQVGSPPQPRPSSAAVWSSRTNVESPAAFMYKH